ncbi:MAG: IS1 family transposase [Leptolyngbyaceae cyanobacterium SM1_3_5]|nr:IS1 family transposase [Leptolyngbyaceae cyanobacterium SM1_3_5]
MEEDFQNATQIFTAAAAKVWIEKHLKGTQMTTFLDRLSALNQLCDELNQAEEKSAYPNDPTSKKVSPDAYRIALVVSPREPDPFFLQLPPYSRYVGQLQGVTFPDGAIVTAPKDNQIALGLMESEDTKPKSACGFCGHPHFRRKGTYKGGKTKYVCSQCGRVPSPGD